VIVNRATAALVRALAQRGFEVLQTPLSEFMKAGGSAKCLTLRLDEP
jgi:arginine dihydrolase